MLSAFTTADAMLLFKYVASQCLHEVARRQLVGRASTDLVQQRDATLWLDIQVE